MTAISKASAKAYFETLHHEEWRPIPNHAPYEASSLGRIRNKSKHILVPVVWGNRGHVAVKVGGGRKASKKYVHRLVLMAFDGMPKEGQIACHRNDVKTENRISNLYWGTYKENTADQIRNGLFYFAVGEGNGRTEYADDIVDKIRSEYTGKRGEQSALARKYNMHVSNVHLIVHNKTRVK